jgi:hypothetical protein
MAFARIGNILVALHTAAPPSPEEWAEYMRALRQVDLAKLVTIVFTDGGGPNSAQRKEVNDTLKGRASPSAVVTGNTFARSLVAALAWFNPSLRAFAPDRTSDAFEHLKLTRAESESVRTQVRLLHAQFILPLRCIAV